MSWLSNKFSKFNQEEGSQRTRRILCPNCGSEQNISLKAALTFCKGCQKIIDVKKAQSVEDESDDGSYNEPAVAEEIEPESRPKEFKEYVEPSKSAERFERERQRQTASPLNEIRHVKCSHCATSQDVPAIALSSFCKKCGQRINLQDYEIRGKFQGDLDTRGTIFLSEDADVRASINVSNAVIRGRIKGTIIAEKSVKLTQTGKIFGTVNTPNFIVEEGAVFVGKAEINADQLKS